MNKLTSIAVLPLLITLLSSQTNLSLTTPGPYIDFGTKGKTYPIVENDIVDELEEGAKSLIFNEKSIHDKIISQVNAAANVKSNLPLCLIDKTKHPIEDSFTVPTDIYNPAGRIVYKKGQRFSAPLAKGIILDLCFVDASNTIAAKNQINSMSITNPNCVFLLANNDIRQFADAMPELQIYPVSNAQESRFNVECYPSVVRMQGNTIQVTEHSFDKYKN